MISRQKVSDLIIPLSLAATVSLGSGCSIKKMALHRMAGALSGSAATLASDNDPQLVKDAAPFSLKLMEALLAQQPAHQGLLLACCSGFTQYAYAFVQQDADEIEDKDIEAATALRLRARKLYLRARDYGLRGLDLRVKDFSARLRQHPRSALQPTQPKDVSLLYWTALSWAGAIAVSKDDPALIAELPLVDSLIDRAFVLDEDYSKGAIHSFLIGFEWVRRDVPGDPLARAKSHFDRAVELSGGQLAGPFVAWAESVSLQKQNRPEFESMLNRALAINPDARPESRLGNLVMQRRAQWLLSRLDELFLDPILKPEKPGQ